MNLCYLTTRKRKIDNTSINYLLNIQYFAKNERAVTDTLLYFPIHCHNLADYYYLCELFFKD